MLLEIPPYKRGKEGEAFKGVVVTASEIVIDNPPSASLPPFLRGTQLRLSSGFLLSSNCALARSLAGSSIGVGSLATGRQRFPMPRPPVRTDLHESLNVHGDFFPQIALDRRAFFNHLPEPGDFVLGQILHFGIEADVSGR